MEVAPPREGESRQRPRGDEAVRRPDRGRRREAIAHVAELLDELLERARAPRWRCRAPRRASESEQHGAVETEPSSAAAARRRRGGDGRAGPSSSSSPPCPPSPGSAWRGRDLGGNVRVGKRRGPVSITLGPSARTPRDCLAWTRAARGGREPSELAVILLGLRVETGQVEDIDPQPHPVTSSTANNARRPRRPGPPADQRARNLDAPTETARRHDDERDVVHLGTAPLPSRRPVPATTWAGHA